MRLVRSLIHLNRLRMLSTNQGLIYFQTRLKVNLLAKWAARHIYTPLTHQTPWNQFSKLESTATVMLSSIKTPKTQTNTNVRGAKLRWTHNRCLTTFLTSAKTTHCSSTSKIHLQKTIQTATAYWKTHLVSHAQQSKSGLLAHLRIQGSKKYRKSLNPKLPIRLRRNR